MVMNGEWTDYRMATWMDGATRTMNASGEMQRLEMTRKGECVVVVWCV